MLPDRPIPLLQLEVGKAKRQPGTILGMGLEETGLVCWPADGVRLRPSGQNQGQAQLETARQPGPRAMARHRPGCNMEGLLLQQSQALTSAKVRLHGQGIVRLVLSFIKVCCMDQLQLCFFYRQ